VCKIFPFYSTVYTVVYFVFPNADLTENTKHYALLSCRNSAYRSHGCYGDVKQACCLTTLSTNNNNNNNNNNKASLVDEWMSMDRWWNDNDREKRKYPEET
jgi:hypothetical protein